jgi:hypothetical protein
MRKQATLQAGSGALIVGAHKQESDVEVTRTGKHVVARPSEFS